MVRNHKSQLKLIQISPTDLLKDAISVIEGGHVQFALVVDNNEKLIGTITDGDVRRALLRGDTLDTQVASVMCTNFKWLNSNATEEQAMSVMRREVIQHIPALDEEGRVNGLFWLEDVLKRKARPNSVVIMAGGKGQRLGALTKNCPKPMLIVGGKPMLENILEHCIDAGFHSYYISVNYLKHQIKEYFGDGSRWGVQIIYLEENQPLGTGGSLSLLPEGLIDPILVMNGDVLTKVDYGRLLQFHHEQKASATLCVIERLTQVQYGVVHTNNLSVEKIEEKPLLRYNANAGIYIVSPMLLDLVPHDCFFDMPQLIDKAIGNLYNVVAFPIHEYWIDVGHHESLGLAKRDWLPE